MTKEQVATTDAMMNMERSNSPYFEGQAFGDAGWGLLPNIPSGRGIHSCLGWGGERTCSCGQPL